jgi:transcriptional regulator GlxA family with amidase domain
VTTRQPRRQIARDFGFADGAHFGKMFRRFPRHSPAAYRRAFG